MKPQLVLRLTFGKALSPTKLWCHWKTFNCCFCPRFSHGIWDILTIGNVRQFDELTDETVNKHNRRIGVSFSIYCGFRCIEGPIMQFMLQVDCAHFFKFAYFSSSLNWCTSVHSPPHLSSAFIPLSSLSLCLIQVVITHCTVLCTLM